MKRLKADSLASACFSCSSSLSFSAWEQLASPDASEKISKNRVLSFENLQKSIKIDHFSYGTKRVKKKVADTIMVFWSRGGDLTVNFFRSKKNSHFLVTFFQTLLLRLWNFLGKKKVTLFGHIFQTLLLWLAKNCCGHSERNLKFLRVVK